jgi:hypothetical protein
VPPILEVGTDSLQNNLSSTTGVSGSHLSFQYYFDDANKMELFPSRTTRAPQKDGIVSHQIPEQLALQNYDFRISFQYNLVTPHHPISTPRDSIFPRFWFP